jgi:hypothetical protein
MAFTAEHTAMKGIDLAGKLATIAATGVLDEQESEASRLALASRGAERTPRAS